MKLMMRRLERKRKSRGQPRARALYRSFIAGRVCLPTDTETHYYRVCEVITARARTSDLQCLMPLLQQMYHASET
jgi:hypothetical protein